jgi:folate-binding protein YgfZ
LSYEKYLSIEGSKDILGFTIRYREDPIILDPRNKNLGARLIINLEKLYLSLKKLNLKNDKIENYYTHCHKIGVVPKYLNKLQNKLFGIECNYEDLNGIDFKKGCYVGQENTARIKLKNKLSKRLLPIEVIDGSLSDEEKIYNNEVEIGKVLIDGEYPFALIKFLDKNFNKDQIFKSKNCSFRICVPQWLKI